MKQKHEYGLWLNQPQKNKNTEDLVFIKTGMKGEHLLIKHADIEATIDSGHWRKIQGDDLLIGDRVKLIRREADVDCPYFYIHRMKWDPRQKTIKYQLRQNMKLESVIHANPDDEDAWSVYGDWLLTRNDPLGEMVALEIAHRKNPEDEPVTLRKNNLFRTFEDYWRGEILDAAIVTPKSNPVLKLEWQYGFIQKAALLGHKPKAGPGTMEIYTNILKSPAAKFLRELVLSPAVSSKTPFNDYVSNLETLKIIFHNKNSSSRSGPSPILPLAISKSLPRLKHLTLMEVKKTDYISAELLTSPLIQGLESLTLVCKDGNNDIWDPILKNQESLQHLKKVSLKNNYLEYRFKKMLEKIFGDRIEISP